MTVHTTHLKPTDGRHPSDAEWYAEYHARREALRKEADARLAAFEEKYGSLGETRRERR